VAWLALESGYLDATLVAYDMPGVAGTAVVECIAAVPDTDIVAAGPVGCTADIVVAGPAGGMSLAAVVLVEGTADIADSAGTCVEGTSGEDNYHCGEGWVDSERCSHLKVCPDCSLTSYGGKNYGACCAEFGS